MKTESIHFFSKNMCRGCVNNGAWICDGCDPKGCIFRAPLPEPVRVTDAKETGLPQAA